MKQDKEVLNGLVAARTVISREDTFIKGTLAADKHGEDIVVDHYPVGKDGVYDWRKWEEMRATHPEACRWCAIGAITLSVPKKFQAGVKRELAEACRNLYGKNSKVLRNARQDDDMWVIADVNDHRYGHKLILEAFDHAISQLGG